MIAVWVEHQLVDHTDSQSALHHGQDGIVVADLIPNVGFLLKMVQEFGDLIVLLLLQVDEVLAGQPLKLCGLH